MIEFRGNSIKLQIWDSAGQERYKALIPSYVRGASVIFIVYDISSKNSFINVETWINFITQVNTDDSLLVLCGNKTDLNREVSAKDGQILAEKNNMKFFETSAKNGHNINLMMYTAIAELPFFSQFDVDKETLIKELEAINGKNVQNSIYDVVKDKNDNNLKVTGQDTIGATVIIPRKKRACVC